MRGWEKRLEDLEGRIGIPNTEEERRMSETRERVNAELERVEARIRSMSPEELKAWRESPQVQAEKRALEAEIERRCRGEPA